MFKRKHKVAEPTQSAKDQTALLKAIVDGQSRPVHDPKATYALALISQGKRAA